MEEDAAITTTDIMLEHAKSRSWESAIAVLRTLPTKVSASLMPTLTLQYNCALSAAVQEPAASVAIFEQMRRLMVEQNSTTFNTVMSSMSKSDTLWQQALGIFGTIPPSTKDSSSYLVALSILNKHSLWEEALDVFQRMKATPSMSRPPLVVYELAIGSTHRFSWAATLRLFQEMLKVHGAANAKEMVTSRVIRSLETAKRGEDVVRVQKELDKAKKKKKKD
jgi:pentatricopeptide repeat protein